ncbi:MAG: fibronectin type III domain-containing protein, partial [Spirochaetaceae bacterium]|nr:fibronectin type III domain-containing protein [Spirochaetaceae bacterium]
AGVCARTPAVRDAIVAAVAGVAACGEVTAAHLSAIAALDLAEQGLVSLRSGDFDGLTAVAELDLSGNRLSTLRPADFDGLTALQRLRLDGNRLHILPAGAFAGMTALTHLYLHDNRLAALRADHFADLGALRELWLAGNRLRALPEHLFAGPAALTHLYLHDNALAALPAGLLAGLDELTELRLDGNVLDALPAGLFTGVGALSALRLDGNFGAPFSLAVALAQDGADGFLVRIAEGAPFEVVIGFTVDDGTPATGSVTVAAGAVAGDRVTVSESMAGTLPTISLGDPPAVPDGIQGVELVVRGSPLTVRSAPAAPGGVAASGSDDEIILTWTDPADAAISGYQVRIRTKAGTWPSAWQDVPDSGAATVYHRLTGLNNGTAYEVQVRAGNAAGWGMESATVEATPQAGICARTAAVRTAILAEIANVTDCAAVTAAHLAGISSVAASRKGIAALRAGDFDGLVGLTSLFLNDNSLTELPAGVFDGLAALTRLELNGNDLTALPAGVFDGLGALTFLHLEDNSLEELPAGVFDGLQALTRLDLFTNDLSELPAGIFAELGALTRLELSGNDLTALPVGVFDGLEALTFLNLGRNDLTALPVGVFDGLGALTTLFLLTNDLEKLSAGVLAGLDALTSLDLSANDLTEIAPDALHGLTALTSLFLFSNQLQTLPAGVFAGLGALTTLNLTTNPGAPFTLTLEPVLDGRDGFRVRVAAGAPFAMSVAYSVAGGTPATGTVTVARGATDSARVEVTPATAGVRPVVTLAGAAPTPPRTQTGLATAVSGASLTLTAAPAAPTGVTATGAAGSILLRWSDAGDGSITGYQVRSREHGAGAWDAWADVAGSSAGTVSHRLSGLVDDTGYEVQVRAGNIAGWGPASATVQATPRAGVCARTPAVRDAIVAAVAGVAACGEVTAAHLSAIAALDLAEQGLV